MTAWPHSLSRSDRRGEYHTSVGRPAPSAGGFVQTSHALEEQGLGARLDHLLGRLEARIQAEVPVRQGEHCVERLLTAQLAPHRVENRSFDEVNLPLVRS